jgi:sarcosine oxidase subunit alpha
MTGAFRTPSGGRIDRRRRLGFTFDGKRLEGFAGDTLASALLANGVHFVARSFKYHRPRGILAAGSEEANALVTVSRGGGRETPNVRATEIELYEGLTAESQNRWPTLEADIGAVNDRLAPILPAGFYYKTFMGSRRLWSHVYEPIIRRAAGLGKAPELPDPDRYLQRHAHCEVLVVGAGPAGLAAALAAAAGGLRVILCDEQNELGGSLLSETVARIDGMPAAAWVGAQIASLAAMSNVRLLTRTTAFGIYPDNHVGLLERVTDHLADPDPELPRERLWQVRAGTIVLATGAIERPLVFPDNDRPGIMLAGAGITYLERFGVLPGQRGVVVGSSDTIYRAALAMRRHGIEVAAAIDTRDTGQGPLCDEARAAGIPIHTRATVCGTRGRRRVRSLALGDVGPEGRVDVRDHIACDHVLMSAGWTPNVALFAQAGGKLVYDGARGVFLPGAIEAPVLVAGAASGPTDLAEVIDSGDRIGRQAAGKAVALSAAPGRATTRVENAPPSKGGSVGALPHGLDPWRAKAFVDFHNDVTTRDLLLATREGFRSIEHVKRYTTSGMAPDQGKTSNLNALAIVAEALAAPVPEVGLTSFRPPYTPVSFGALAGTARHGLFDPERLTPSHASAVARGAVFEPVGTWQRARYFPLAGEDMDLAVARECRAVRTAAGIFDASTLGKIEVVGPDAAEFLGRVYTARFDRLAVGRARYAIMLTEAGMVMDDGIVARLAPDRFHVTTTTGGAPRVLAAMEDYIQTEWPDLRVWATSVTEQWAVMAVQGPKAREIIGPLVEGIDLATGALPHMSVRTGRIAGVPCRLFRVSFTGELGYEINVPADYGAALWEALLEAGRSAGGVPYGTEAMHVLRAEKGYIIVGQETDGTTTPDDVGLAGLLSKSGRDFIGKRSLAMADLVRSDRKQLVGLLTFDPRVVLEEGAQIVPGAKELIPMPVLGHVTSAYWSEVSGRSIALALVAGGRARLGQTLHVPMPEGAVPVEVVEPVFWDKDGGRLHA